MSAFVSKFGNPGHGGLADDFMVTSFMEDHLGDGSAIRMSLAHLHLQVSLGESVCDDAGELIFSGLFQLEGMSDEFELLLEMRPRGWLGLAIASFVARRPDAFCDLLAADAPKAVALTRLLVRDAWEKRHEPDDGKIRLIEGVLYAWPRKFAAKLYDAKSLVELVWGWAREVRSRSARQLVEGIWLLWPELSEFVSMLVRESGDWMLHVATEPQREPQETDIRTL